MKRVTGVSQAIKFPETSPHHLKVNEIYQPCNFYSLCVWIPGFPYFWKKKQKIAIKIEKGN